MNKDYSAVPSRRPRSIALAVALIGVSVALSLLEVFGRRDVLEQTSIVFVCLLNAGLLYCVWVGKRWARLLLLILLVGGATALTIYSGPVGMDLRQWIPIALDSIGVLLLFLQPARGWLSGRLSAPMP